MRPSVAQRGLGVALTAVLCDSEAVRAVSEGCEGCETTAQMRRRCSVDEAQRGTIRLKTRDQRGAGQHGFSCGAAAVALRLRVAVRLRAAAESQ